MVTKKSFLVTGIIGTFFVLLLLWLGTDTCYSDDTCRIVRKTLNNDNLTISLIFPIITIFSLLTYRMHDRVFRAWWNFARWWVPVIVVVTFIVNAQPHNGSFFSMEAFSNAVTIGFFYAIFVIVSLVQIIRAYRRSKK